MELKDLVAECHKRFIIEEKSVFTLGKVEQLVFKFDNGYGVSLVCHRGSYGNELAIIKFDDNGDWDLDYSTCITNDVLGYLTEEEINSALSACKHL